MKIVVLVKEVPDTYGERRLSLETGIADRAATDAVLDEIGERALEVALRHADEHPGTEVVVLTMGPERAEASIRKALAMGAAEAVHIVDDRLAGADLSLTAETLAAAIRVTGFDLVVTGNTSTDGAGGVLPAMLAELLGVPHVTALLDVAVTVDTVSGVRATDGGSMRVAAALPAVVSVTEQLPDARFASFKNIMAAKKKPYRRLDLSELGVAADDEGAARSIMIAVAQRPARVAGTKIVDSGDAGERIAEFLIQNRLA